MAVQLAGSEGYYTRVVEVRGSKFYIADLGARFPEFLDRVTTMQEATGAAEVEAALGDPQAMQRVVQSLAADVERQKSVYANMVEIADWVLSVGLTNWNIPGADCTDETRRLLPPAVKSELVREILRESQLTLGEASFPRDLGAGDAAR
jgi:hypothetical protein